ncbi:MAG: radical SAM family heme chaperone HemW [Clostridia bacterium]
MKPRIMLRTMTMMPANSMSRMQNRTIESKPCSIATIWLKPPKCGIIAPGVMRVCLQLYLHFPFCKWKCRYCDFCSEPAGEEAISAYCAALCAEIRQMGPRFAGQRVSTVFLGGGTPSIVPAEQMAHVLATLETSFCIAPGAEYTTEANPGTLTAEWLEQVQRHGVNRLSLGAQAAQDGLLKALGRIHTFAQTEEAVRLARECGIRNLNLDLMSGLPGQTLADYRESIERLCALRPEHISAYSLILEEGTPLYEDVRSGVCTLGDDDLTADMYEQGILWLEQRGYRRYEVSNFAREGYACRHNCGYWQGAWYVGLGIAAHSLLSPSAEQRSRGVLRVRRANTTNRDAYVRALAAGEAAPAEEQEIGAQEAMFETMMLGLRMVKGVSEADFQRLHGRSLRGRYGQALDSLARDGLGLWSADGRFALTSRGLELQNDALLRLM